MALSNILKEPRREITEIVVGIAIVAPFIWLDTVISAAFQNAVFNGPTRINAAVGHLLGMAVGAMVIGLGFIALMLIHNLGDIFCCWLDENGIHLRPKNRANRW